jgi:hypothetical protein
MTVPGVNVIVAASFVAAVGDIHRFDNPRKLVGYLGWTRGCASPARPPPAAAGSPSRARCAPATRW